MPLDNLNFHDIVGANSLAKKYVKYDFQELGLMIAKKLNDENRKSFYIKLAKYENRELLMDAFTYTLYSNNKNSLAKLFLWKLRELRQTKKFRAFIGVFPIGWGIDVEDFLADLRRNINPVSFSIKLIPLKKLHITLKFFHSLPAFLFFPLSLLIETFYKQKNDYFETSIVANRVRLWNSNGRYYLIIDDFDSTIYRIYYSFMKFIKNSKSKYSNQLVKLISNRNRFFPHITLVRLYRFNKTNLSDSEKTSLTNININGIEIKFKPCITLATSHFINYKNSVGTYYSLNYGIGGCWHKKNL